jgi:hypothetical protein
MSTICNGKHESTGMMRTLCAFGIHWHGRTDSGIRYNQRDCHVCKSEVLGIFV